jgi:hypothetical protein
MEFRIPSNENSSVKKLKQNTKRIVYAAEFRKGSCIRNAVYLLMSSVLNRLKNKIIVKNEPLKLKLSKFCDTKSRGIPQNSAEFDEFFDTELRIFQRN